jgi:hypothetical protein
MANDFFAPHSIPGVSILRWRVRLNAASLVETGALAQGLGKVSTRK